MASSKKVGSAFIWNTIVNIVTGIYGFISVPILIEYFGKSQYGLIGLAMSINVYLRLMDMGFTNTNVRFFSNWIARGDKEKVKKLFQTSMAFYGTIGLINGIVLVVLSFFSQSIFTVTPEQDIILKKILYVLAISAFFSWYSSCFDQIIKATENVAWIQKITLIPKILQILILFVTVYAKLSLLLYFILTTFAMLCVVPMSISKIKKELRYVNFIPKFDFKILKEILPYCLGIFSFSIFQFSFYNLRAVFLGMQGTMDSVADYRIINGICNIVVMISSAFMNVMLPTSAKVVAQGNKEAYYRIAYDGTKYVSIVCCFCCFGLISIAKEALCVYVGASFLYLLPWLDLWLLCTLCSHNQAISSLILSGTDIRAITYCSAVSSIVGLVISWFLIPYYQVGGVVIAYCVYGIMQLSFYYFYYWPRKMQINPSRVFFKSFLPYLVIGVGLSVALNYTPNIGLDDLYTGIIKGMTFSIVFSLLCWATLNKEDKKFIKQILHIKK